MTDPDRSLRVGSSAPWAKGRARNTPPADWPAIKRRLRRLLRDIKPGTNPENKLVSRAAIARMLGVAEISVRRWLLPPSNPRHRNPSAETVERLRAWLRGK